MEIVVCIKQVPETSEVEIDEEKGVLKREGIDSKMNPFDLHALELGIHLKEQLGGRVTAVSMGPPQAVAVLREGIMMGADAGVLISDRKFAGADTLATAYTLGRAIRKLGAYDVIVCGMQTTDGDTAQVGPGLAEILDLPHISYVTRLVSADEKRLVVEMDMTESIEVMAVSPPCVLTVTRAINQPRLPSYRRKLAMRDDLIMKLTARDLAAGGGEMDYFGLDGSPTRVEKIFPPENNQKHEIWEGMAASLSERLIARLKELRLI